MDQQKLLPVISLVIFGAFAVGGLLLFSFLGPRQNGDEALAQGNVTMWGTVSRQTMAPLIEILTDEYSKLNLEYVQKDPATFDTELLEALASGTGPDLFFLPDSDIVKNRNKVYPIPYENYPEQTFRSQFIDHAELYLSHDGVLAFPILVDPMMLYYNRSMLSSAFLLEPPRYWSDFSTLVPELSVVDSTGVVNLSALAMGTFRNVPHAKDMLSLLLLQTGNDIIAETDDGYASVLHTPNASYYAPTLEALSFYTSFSDPSLETYNWNSSLPEPRQAFLGEELAFYLGYASEFPSLEITNPNLSFSVTSVPQISASSLRRGYGKLYALAISRVSKNIPASFVVARRFSSADFSQALADALSVASPVRSNLASVRTDEVAETVRLSAIISRSWYDPDPATTEGIFSDMITGIVSGFEDSARALFRAHGLLDRLATE